VTGGLSLGEPASDLAVAAAVASSALGRAVPERSVLAGEIGLTGEVRRVARLEARLREASRLGFSRACVPPNGADSPSDEPLEGLRTYPVHHVEEAFRLLFDGRGIRSGRRRAPGPASGSVAATDGAG
jgi:DNA repair protein RadA/Sms